MAVVHVVVVVVVAAAVEAVTYSRTVKSNQAVDLVLVLVLVLLWFEIG